MTAPLDLAGLAAWVSRPDATPAPTTTDCGHIAGDRCTDTCQNTRDLIELAYAPVWDLREVS
ncbi:hypothetical protein ABZ793_12025 [Micromonospora sp. NPDC047465]|uniref:hypothetical protein n=1 Tax=Micromonospora sp. NPDC047465 TaxID=3154813 RepID=UPI0033FFE026